MRRTIALTSDDIAAAAAAARLEAMRIGCSVSIVVTDGGGHPLFLERMDGAFPLTATIALRKAWTAAVSSRATTFWEERVKERATMGSIPDILPLQGGLPVLYEGECVGGIGVSGAPLEQDEMVAAAALRAMETAWRRPATA